MGARIIWSPEAADDLEQIADFIGRDSPRYARQVATEFYDCASRHDWECVRRLSSSPSLPGAVRKAVEPLGSIRSVDYQHETSVDHLERGHWSVRFGVRVLYEGGSRRESVLLVKRENTPFRVAEYEGAMSSGSE